MDELPVIEYISSSEWVRQYLGLIFGVIERKCIFLRTAGVSKLAGQKRLKNDKEWTKLNFTRQKKTYIYTSFDFLLIFLSLHFLTDFNVAALRLFTSAFTLNIWSLKRKAFNFPLKCFGYYLWLRSGRCDSPLYNFFWFFLVLGFGCGFLRRWFYLGIKKVMIFFRHCLCWLTNNLLVKLFEIKPATASASHAPSSCFFGSFLRL